jgi:hypothetical protein
MPQNYAPIHHQQTKEMQALQPVDPKTATGQTKELFATMEQRLKRIPNMIRVMANSPAILSAYLRFNEASETTKITPKLRCS